MAIVKNHISVLDGGSQGFTDRVIMGQSLAVAFAASAGQVIPIVFADALPANYQVIITPSAALGGQPAFVTAKTSLGFSITIPGTPAGAGTLDILVIAL